MDIYITRHGETDWNKDRRIQGQTDIPLNQKGIELAQLTAAGLEKEGIHFDRAYSSPLQRAYKTAQILTGASGIEIIKDRRITEIAFGEGEGACLDDLETKEQYRKLSLRFTKPEAYRAEKGAESFEQTLERTKDFLDNELKPLEGKYESVLVSCHGGVARSLLLNINGWPLARYWEIQEPNCAVNLVTLQDGVFSIQYMGKTFYEVRREGIL